MKNQPSQDLSQANVDYGQYDLGVMHAIEQWLKAHAPNLRQYSLQTAATTAQILHFEQVLAKPVPEDFKAFYLWHDGLSNLENCGSLFYAMDVYPIAQVEERYIEKSDMVDQLVALKAADLGIDAHNAFNADWIKFAGDGDCTGLYLDLAPTAQGHYGQVIFIDEELEIAFIVARSIKQLLEGFNADLQAGYYQLDQDALEDGHEFLQCDAAIDLTNWQFSQRWKNRIQLV